jgi:hypothetical protein
MCLFNTEAYSVNIPLGVKHGITRSLPSQDESHHLLLKLLALTYTEELGAAGPAGALSGRSAILQGNRGRSADLSLGSAFEAIGFHVDASFS